MTRNEAREIMMQIMFELDASKRIEKDKTIDKADAKERLSQLAESGLAGGHITRAKELIGNVLDNLDNIDSTIDKVSTKWKVSRMPKVDLAIMRLACGEMRYCKDIPEAVSINEAINLAKKYSTENSARFIHGVLGAIAKSKE